MPDSAHFCFVAVFRPASVQTPHTEIHTVPFSPRHGVSFHGSERDVRASAYFHPRIERVTKHPSLSRRNPFCHRSPAVFQIPNLASRLSKLEISSVHRPCKRYSIFRLAASRMLNTSYAVHVRIYERTYVSSERRKEFRERGHWLNRALTHRQIAIRKSSRLRS